MKIAISATGDSVNSKTDPRFGRAPFFAIYDSEKDETLFVENRAAEMREGAGPVAVRLIADNSVSKVVSGEFGAKVQPLLKQLQIEMVANDNPENRVIDIINSFK